MVSLYDSVLLGIQRAAQPYVSAFLHLLYTDPHHVIIESGLALFIIWLIFIRKTVNPTMEAKTKLSSKEKEWLIESWVPEPLVPKNYTPIDFNIIDKVEGNYLFISGIQERVLNLNSFDFLGFSRLPAVKTTATAALEKYGCGSCGPRGFYGTIDVHLEFEKRIAAFMDCEEAISYSDSASAVSSSIPAFSKKGDLLLVDEACSEAILMGVNLSRSTVYFFKHNDMADLRLILASIAEDDVANRRDSTQQRRFIVVEGIYRNTGAICPLKELIELKEQYKYRLILDESLSFGVLGASGRGITEHFHLPPDAVEILTIAMDCSLASVGGVCVGTREIVDHQRLAGAGYCFSAAAPPFLSAVAIATLDELQRSSAAVDSLRKLVPRFHTMLEKVRGLTRLSSCSTCTPVVHLVFAERIGDPQEEEERMRTLETTLLRRGVAACSPTYPPDAKSRLLKSSTFCYRPSLRLLLHAQLTDADLTFAISVLQSAVDKVLLPPKSPGAVGDRGDDSRRIPNQ